MNSIGIILSVMLAGVALFQLLLALGLPYGRAAWGGQHVGALPRNLRIGSVASLVFLSFAAIVVLSKSEVLNLFSQKFEDYFMWFLAAYFALGVPMNVISRSKVERLWAPYIATMLILSLLLVKG